MGTRPVLLFVRIPEVPADIESDWNHWYGTVHMPARLAMPGFVAARRFRAIFGEHRYLTLYELAGMDALTSEPYLALRARERAMPATSFEAVTTQLPGFERGIYEQFFPVTGEYTPPASRTLFALGHDVPAGCDDEFNAWYNTEHIPSMMERVPGFLTARRYRLTEAKLPPDCGVQTPRPRYATIYDLADDHVLDTDAFKAATVSPWSTRVRSWYHRRFRILARQM